MKKIIYLLMALPLFFASCSNDESAVCDETVEVSFCTTLPQIMGTRATGDLTVNNVVCAVFDGNNVEVPNLRRTVTIDGNSITFAPQLIKGRTYKVVFWAMKDNNYNVENLAAITRATNGSTAEADYDAFTATTEIFVENAATKAVTLTRPIAQLNIGIPAEDWTTLTSTFGQEPAATTVSYSGKDSFNALTGTTTGNDVTIERTSPATGAAISVNSKDYKQLGTYYLFEDDKSNINITYSVADNNANNIRSNVEILNVPVWKNYKTNVVGGLLTGTITYNITIAPSDFLTDDALNIE